MNKMSFRCFLTCLILWVGYGLNAQAACVMSDRANLRSGPGPNHSINWTVGKYTPLIVQNRRGNWAEVEDMDGEKHWIYRPNINERETCLSISGTIANLRTAPSGSAALGNIRRVDRYTPFLQLDRRGAWFKVRGSWGDEYWVHESLVWRPLKVVRINY